VKLRNLTLAGIAAACLGVATLASAAPAGAAAEHYDTTARAAIAAACSTVVDGSGTDQALVSDGHGLPVDAEYHSGATEFQALSVDGFTQFEACGTTNCITNNSSVAYMEGCASHSSATLWTFSGGLIRNQETGYVLTAAEMTSCNSESGVYVVGGSWPSCAQHWTAP
jgi:hypothetical protein